MKNGDPEEVSTILLSPKGSLTFLTNLICSFQPLTISNLVICDICYCADDSYLKGLIPIFNECVDQFLERLRPLADGKTQVPMKEEFAAVTMDVICKVPTYMVHRIISKNNMVVVVTPYYFLI